MQLSTPLKLAFIFITFSTTFLIFHSKADGQMRKVYVDTFQNSNELLKLSFYSPSEGFVAFREWMGYTTDSGRTFTKKYITANNVDYNGYQVNLTFGFGIKGAKAFSQNNLIVYGDYGFIPAILHSTDGGNTFKLIYHSQYNQQQISGGIRDMIFSQNNSIGYAIDADRILKTTNQGLNWTVIRINPGAYPDNVEAVDNNTVFVLSTNTGTNKLIKTTNGGSSWQNVALPVIQNGFMSYAYFVTANVGWVSMYNTNNQALLFKTTDGGFNWTLLNDNEATPFGCSKMKFTDLNTGYAFTGLNTIYKTTNGGVLWEQLTRDNNYEYFNFSHNDLQFITANQFWAGGAHGLLELTTNAGGVPVPKAYFKTDTTGITNTNNVNLINFSKTGYNYKWFVNDTLISTAYNASYIHNIYRTRDTIKLVTINGSLTDTLVKLQYFHPPVIVTAFTPTTAGTGRMVSITGSNFTGATSVTFGGVPAQNFIVYSATSIGANVGSGASGSVTVFTPQGRGSLSGFIFAPFPSITSFSPVSAVTGTVVTITGTGFTGATSVKFGGVEATSFTVVSSTSITATVPVANSGNVSVTTPGGTASLGGFTALPTITSFDPVIAAQGNIVTITGTSFTGVTGVTFGGVNAVSFTVVSSTKITAVVGAGASGTVVILKGTVSVSQPGFTWTTAPVITSFSPASGPVGTTVVINGSGFDPVVNNNIVFFGATRAVVTAGSATSLTVTVPTGATFDPISVTNNGLSGYAFYPFLVTFPNGGSITANSFATRTIITNGGPDAPSDVIAGDIDGDGKVDLMVTHYSDNSANNGVLVYRNTSTGSTVSFAAPLNIGNLGYTGASSGDFNGDGKPDLAIMIGARIALFRNISVPGTITFTPDSFIVASSDMRAMVIADMDGDGKTDITACNRGFGNGFGTYVYRNASSTNAIAFATGVKVYVSFSERNMLSTDLDGDGKPDLVVSGGVVIRNNSTPGNLVFAAPITIPGYASSSIIAGDIDGDAKTDILSGDNNGSKLVVFRNISSVANISFEAPVQFDATSSPSGIALSDMDGDGKPDVTAVLSNCSMAVFKNISTPGTISFGPKVNYTPGTFIGFHALTVGDIDSDGKSDVIVVAEVQRSVSVHINKVLPEPSVHTFIPTIGGSGTAVTISGANFTGVAGVSFGGVPAESYVVNSPTSISAVVGSGASGGVTVTNNFGTGTKPGYVFGTPPTITSISPTQGTVGSTVVITGTNFSPVAVDNIVYFGGVKATVASATNSSLQVVVPPGPTNQPFTVTTNNLTAYSTQHFGVTFSGAVSSFSSATFAPPLSRPNGAGRGDLCDIDGDGKLDLVISAGTNGASMAVARNISTPGNIAFAATSNFYVGAVTFGPVCGDLDGDGKPDVVIYNETNSITVLRNQSTPGTISLTFAGSYSTASSTANPFDAGISDLDGDGKPEIVVVNYHLNTMSVFKNRSTPGSISFEPRIDYATASSPSGVVLKDLNNDGKAEIIVAAYGYTQLNIFRNISIPGTIVLGNRQDIACTPYPLNLEVADVNNDGKLDIVTANTSGNSISVFKNQSADSGTIVLAAAVNIAASGNNFYVSNGDMDGDGKIDMVQCAFDNKKISILKNTSASGNVTFQPGFNFSLPGNPHSASVGDLDGDGYPDIAVYVTGAPTCFLRNLIGSTSIVQVCTNSSTNLTSNITGSTYQWMQNTGTGFVNISNNSNFSGTNTVTLQISNIPASWNGYSYMCMVNGTQSSNIFNLDIAPPVTASVTISAMPATICSGATVTFTASPVNGGNNPIYQWQLNGTDSGTNSPIFTVSAPAYGSLVKVLMTSSARCVSPVIATSNTDTMRLTNTWIGAVSSAWENTANWSCGILPDGNTDVFINTGPVILNSNGICRTLIIRPGVSFTITTGNTLTITH